MHAWCCGVTADPCSVCQAGSYLSIVAFAPPDPGLLFPILLYLLLSRHSRRSSRFTLRLRISPAASKPQSSNLVGCHTDIMTMDGSTQTNGAERNADRLEPKDVQKEQWTVESGMS